MFENKKILVLGMAKSGYEVCKLLSSKNEIIATDIKEQDLTKLEELSSLNISFIKTDEPENILDSSFDLVIKNPAVFPDNPCIFKAHNLNIPVINEMEVAYHFLPKNVKIIGITGSNGKTTTTTLTYEVLKKAQLPVHLAGNIGTPLSKIVKDIEEGNILLLEISDHQLTDFQDFKTDISVLTNLCPTHLDYHGNYENYKTVKKKIFNHHSSKDIAIINKDNADSLLLTSNIASTKVYFNDDNNYYTTDGIYIDKKLVISLSDILLKGTHNYENILCMLLILKALNIDFKYALEVLEYFKGVEHRLEYVQEINGVTYYNDSKSTNPTATITALKSFKENVYLILGGMDRNQDFNCLTPYMSKVKKVYAIGEVRNRIVDYCEANNILVTSFVTLKEALNALNSEVKPGDIVLLSPASASWDQYLRFEDRGEEFKSIIQNL